MTSQSDTPETFRAKFSPTEAVRYIRGGRGMDLYDWLALPDRVREDLAEAARMVEVEQAVMLATALRSEEGCAEVAARLDGGDWAVRLAGTKAAVSALREVVEVPA